MLVIVLVLDRIGNSERQLIDCPRADRNRNRAAADYCRAAQRNRLRFDHRAELLHRAGGPPPRQRDRSRVEAQMRPERSLDAVQSQSHSQLEQSRTEWKV